MLISFGKCNFKKYLFLLVPAIKLLRESTQLTRDFYDVKNILLQYLFLCSTKFANFIFWFILMKKIQFPKKILDKKKDYLPSEENENYIKNYKSINISNPTKGLSQKEINKNEQENIKKKKYYKQIIILLLSSIIDCISSLSYLIFIRFISNNKEENNSDSISPSKSTNSTNSTNINYSIYNEINQTKDNNKNTETKNSDNAVNLVPFRICFRIILIFIFSLIFLYLDKPYRHQLLSLLLIIIFVIIADSIEILLKIQSIKDYSFTNINILISFIQELFFSLDNVIGAKYLLISNGNVYQLLFFNGLFGILIIIVVSLLTEKIHCSFLNIHEDFCEDNDNLKNILGFDKSNFKMKLFKLLITLILSTIEMACTWLIIFYKTVNHLSVACAIHLIFRFTIGKKNFEINHFLIGIISFILISFMSLVFNEIIILRFCGLETYTTEEIDKRAIEDSNIERLSIESSVEGIVSDD